MNNDRKSLSEETIQTINEIAIFLPFKMIPDIEIYIQDDSELGDDIDDAMEKSYQNALPAFIRIAAENGWDVDDEIMSIIVRILAENLLIISITLNMDIGGHVNFEEEEVQDIVLGVFNQFIANTDKILYDLKQQTS
jgi:hypothetical protein